MINFTSAIQEENESKSNENNARQKELKEDDSESNGKRERQERLKDDYPESIGKTARKKRLEKEKNKSAILNVVECHQDEDMNISLDVRDMVTSPDDKYLVTCSETDQGKIPKVYVWNLENILQGEKNSKGHSIGIQQKDDGPIVDRKINWLLSVDVETIEVNGMEKWIICAGSINGDIYLWSGDIERKTKEWKFNLKTDIFKKLPIDAGNQKAVFKVKIIKESPKSLQVFVILNAIQGKLPTQSNKHCMKKYPITFNSEGNIEEFDDEDYKGDELKGHFGNENEDTGCILVCDFFEDHNSLISGTRDNTIIKWEFKTKELTDQEHKEICEIGTHEDAITSVRIFGGEIKKEESKIEKGKKTKNKSEKKIKGDTREKFKLASGSSDGVIKIWDIEAKTSIGLGRHSNEIVSLELLLGEKFLVSASKDNTIKIWELNNEVLVRNIILDDEIEKWDLEKGKQDQKEFGLDFLKKIILTKNNHYILALKKNKIFVIRNFGRIWHFYRQLKYIKKDAQELYEKIFGENLRQIAKWGDEREETLEDIFKIIKERLTSDSETISSDRKLSKQSILGELGELFIPSFIRFEAIGNQQKEYIKSVQTNYDNYWYSANKMFIQPPHFSWRFKFFLTTGNEKNFKESKYIELRKDNRIILKDRNQSQIRFLMVLDNVPATFIPLLKAINMEVEDDRGDKDTLIFTDFKYSEEGSIKILTNEHKSSKKFVLKPILAKSYFSVSTFKLDERYSRDNYANVFIKKISLEFTESLNPLKSSSSLPQDIYLFEAFRDNFNYPDMDKIQIKIGNNLISTAGKLLDQYLAEFIMLEFIFTIINILILFETGSPFTVIGTITYSLNILVAILIGVLIIFPFIKKLSTHSYGKMKKPSPGIKRIIKQSI